MRVNSPAGVQFRRSALLSIRSRYFVPPTGGIGSQGKAICGCPSGVEIWSGPGAFSAFNPVANNRRPSTTSFGFITATITHTDSAGNREATPHRTGWEPGKKSQFPISKLQRSPKLEAQKPTCAPLVPASDLEVWCLGIGTSLELGAWCLVFGCQPAQELLGIGRSEMG